MTARNALFALYVLACLSAMTWPAFDLLGNRIEPTVFGVPFTLAWVVGWVLLTFVVMVVYDATGEED